MIYTTTAECTSETFTQLSPNCGKKLVYITCIPTGATDTITIDDLSVIQGFYLQMTDGSALAAGTYATNVITLSNGDTVTPITGIVWGY